MTRKSVDRLEFRHGDPEEIDGLLREARDCGVRLTLLGGKLRFDAPSGAMSARLRAALGQHREAIVCALRGPVFRAHGPVQSAPLLYHYHDLFHKVRSGEIGIEFTNSPNSVFRFTGALDTKALIAAIRSVVCLHPILGARAELRDGVPVFVYSRDVSVYSADESHGGERAQAVIDDLVWRRFDLDRDTLFRPFIVKVAAHTHVIGFVLQHLIGDLVSMELIAQDIFRGYTGPRTDPMAQPVEGRLQYSDYLIEMEQWLLSAGLRYRLDYWMRRLQGARSSCLPPDFNVPPDEEGIVRSETLDLPESRPDDIRELASRLGVTVFTLFLAIYYCTLRRALDRSDLVILMMHHGRDHPALAKVVGSFQNQIPVRITAASDTEFAELAQSIQEYCGSSSEYLVPYGNILYEFWRSQTPHVFPELSFLPLPARAIRDDGRGQLRSQPTTPPLTHKSAGQHPYHVVDIAMMDSRARLKCTYLDVLYRKDTIARHLEVFGEVASRVIEHPRWTVAALCESPSRVTGAGQCA